MNDNKKQCEDCKHWKGSALVPAKGECSEKNEHTFWNDSCAYWTYRTKNQAMQGNTRAQHGDEPKTSFLQIRVTPQQKAAYVRAAAGKKLSAWVTKTLDKATVTDN